ncbi:oxidoreductase [Falsochrobactrum shanghaiense]|uniref:Oxidoreductase n=1 Tax=Falsochrobactrum shanghaiense TaxID=2201899 RepID=A0A316JG68_9HYPH|nr:NAD(P)/FAD-dependent oxidoreductase [Falsochrobactrum shanghaiense]PWL19575.1 oxidoreductase [Falsochrobactrum shanghaiense]
MSYDCIIIGGGVAGSSAGFTLARAGLRVLVIDRQPPGTKQKIGECLSGQGIHLLKRSGLFDWARKSQPLEYIGDVFSWGSERLIEKDFILDRFGSGWHLDRNAFDRCLQAAVRSTGADVLVGQVRNARRNENSGWKVQLTDKAFYSRWIVDASGRQSMVSRSLGIKRVADSPLVAVFSWGPNRSPESRTLIEAVPEGWWYTAALPGNRRVVAFHTTPANAKRLVHNEHLFANAMQKTLHLRRHCSFDASWSRLRGMNACGSMLATTAGKDWLAVGDAAMTFEPLSAHGILNALAHGIFGARALLKAFTGDFRELDNLKRDIEIKRANYTQDINSIYSLEKRWQSLFWREKNENQFYRQHQ